MEKIPAAGLAGVIMENGRDRKAKTPTSLWSFKKEDDREDVFFLSYFAGANANRPFRNQVELHPEKTVIARQDTLANMVFLIEKGLVKLVRENSQGGKAIIGLRHRGWPIGAPAVLLGSHYHFTVITILPTLLRAIPRQVFLDHILRNDEFSWHVHRLLSMQILDQMKKIEDMSCLSVEQRLVRLLAGTIRELDLAGPETDRSSIPLTNKELAQLLMITPEHLCRVLKGLETKGYVTHKKGAIVVADPSGLLQAAT
jgi:CRP-like cAMP-binding protein